MALKRDRYATRHPGHDELFSGSLRRPSHSRSSPQCRLESISALSELIHGAQAGPVRNETPRPRRTLQRITSATFPLAIISAMRAKSLYMTRSFSIVGHTDRIAACAAWPRFEVFNGARKRSEEHTSE